MQKRTKCPGARAAVLSCEHRSSGFGLSLRLSKQYNSFGSWPARGFKVLVDWLEATGEGRLGGSRILALFN